MADQRTQPERDFVNNLRQRLLRDQEEQRKRIANQLVVPRDYRPVAARLNDAGLLAKAKIDHVEPDKRRIDIAWPQKRIGVRVATSVRGKTDHAVTDSVYNDLALRERGWLILSVDPYCDTFDEQIDRVISVVNRLGVYRKAAQGC